MRPLPAPDAETAFFWEAAAAGRLDILRCDSCATFVHYPKPACWNCSSTDLTPATVSGRGTIHSFTITHRSVPGFEAPFNVILVELAEQPGLRMVSNLIGAEPRIGMQVQVGFTTVEGVAFPHFTEAS